MDCESEGVEEWVSGRIDDRVERAERGDFNPMASKCVIISKP